MVTIIHFQGWKQFAHVASTTCALQVIKHAPEIPHPERCNKRTPPLLIHLSLFFSFFFFFSFYCRIIYCRNKPAHRLRKSLLQMKTCFTSFYSHSVEKPFFRLVSTNQSNRHDTSSTSRDKKNHFTVFTPKIQEMKWIGFIFFRVSHI